METNAEPLEEKIRNLLRALPNKVSTNHTYMISRIPAWIKHHHDDLYNPRMVAIGPYQDRNEQKFQATEERKQHYLRDFLERNPEVNLEAYTNKLRDLKDQARGCYTESTVNVINDDEFVEMLLLDGCFILELLLKFWERASVEWDIIPILCDLLLIENQLPFFILENLHAMATSNYSLPSNESMVEPAANLKILVVIAFDELLGVGMEANLIRTPSRSINHLLHLYYELSPPEDLKVSIDQNDRVGYGNGSQRSGMDKFPHVIPSATQLLNFGFALRKQNSNNNCELYNNRVLKIPPLIIDSNRQRLLMNLLAFEQRLEGVERIWTGLMVMMNCMVKSTSDLEVLQERGIVLNLLPSADDAIQFFSQLSKPVTHHFNDHSYSKLFQDIMLICESPHRRYRAKLLRDYFNNPWVLLSFMSSILALIFSMTQIVISALALKYSRS